MANQIGLGANPIRVDTAATVITSAAPIFVQAMQWVDDENSAAGIVAAGDDLVMTVNGTLVELNAQIAMTLIWEVSFNQPIRINDLIVSAIDGGTLLIWKV